MKIFSWILFIFFGVAYAAIAYTNRSGSDAKYKKFEYPLLVIALIGFSMVIISSRGEEQPEEAAVIVTPAPTEVVEATLEPTPTKQLSEVKFIPDQEVAERQKVVRTVNLVKYNSAYQGLGWCSLWNQLLEEDLIEFASGQDVDDGSCPEDIQNEVFGEIENGSGSDNVVIGVQILNTSRIIVNFPACIEFGQEGDYFNRTGGAVKSVDAQTNVGTNIIVEPNSFFTFYFRCDENYFE